MTGVVPQPWRGRNDDQGRRVVADDFVTFDEKLDKLLDWKRALSADMLNGSSEISVSELLEPLQQHAGDYAQEDRSR
jgi:hypothetical protein